MAWHAAISWLPTEQELFLEAAEYRERRNSSMPQEAHPRLKISVSFSCKLMHKAKNSSSLLSKFVSIATWHCSQSCLQGSSLLSCFFLTACPGTRDHWTALLHTVQWDGPPDHGPSIQQESHRPSGCPVIYEDLRAAALRKYNQKKKKDN